MNLLSRAGITIAAAHLRAIEAGTRVTVGHATSEGVWSGADADRFAREWEDLVSARLRSAARHLDTIDLNPFT